jgi:hypothetical protein
MGAPNTKHYYGLNHFDVKADILYCAECKVQTTSDGDLFHRLDCSWAHPIYEAQNLGKAIKLKAMAVEVEPDAPWWSESSARLHADSLRRGILPGQESLLTGLLRGAADVISCARRQLHELRSQFPDVQLAIKPIIDMLDGLTPPK